MKLTHILLSTALIWFFVGIWLLLIGDAAYAGVSGIMGVLFGLIAFCSALRDANYFKDVGEIKHTP